MPQSTLPDRRLLAQWLRQGLRVLRRGGPGALLQAARAAWRRHAEAAASDYPRWVRENSTPGEDDCAAMAAEIGAFARPPRISIITPVYNTPEPFLRAAIDSVLAQVYPYWELCLADDASSEPHVRKVLEEYRGRDERVKVVFREANGHICAASNSALAQASGEFVALLDHDDELARDALFWVARELSRFPDCVLAYTDEDKIDQRGERAHPYLKPDWNPDLFLSHNLAAHLGVYRTERVRRLGGFREGFEGAQDYDLALRVVEEADCAQVRHIPRVLYHWRMLPGSTAIGAFEKSYAADRARRAIEEHLRRQGVAAAVETIAPLGVQRVRYALPSPRPLVSLIVPAGDAVHEPRFFSPRVSVSGRYEPLEVLAIDTNEEASADVHARNRVAGQARGEFLVFLGRNIEIASAEAIVELVSQAQRHEIGAVGGKIRSRDGTIVHAGTVLMAGHAHRGRRPGDSGYMNRADLVQAVSAVSGDCLCIRRRLFEESGGFDGALANAFADVDLCLRLNRMGHRTLFTPHAEFRQLDPADASPACDAQAMRRYANEAKVLRERWANELVSDPYYNPNLTLDGVPYTLAWPTRLPRWRDAGPNPVTERP